MNKEDKYLAAIKALKNNPPVLTNKEVMTDDIMRRIKESSGKLNLKEKLACFLFGWVNIYWLRGSMAVAAIFFTGFFIIQQLMIAGRLEKLEKQSIRMENMINSSEPLLGMNHRILVNRYTENQLKEDSIKVSAHDLEELVNNYWELLRNRENITKDDGLNHFKQKRIKKRLGQSANDNEL